MFRLGDIVEVIECCEDIDDENTNEEEICYGERGKVVDILQSNPAPNVVVNFGDNYNCSQTCAFTKSALVLIEESRKNV